MCTLCILSVQRNMHLKCFFQNAQYAFWVFLAICAWIFSFKMHNMHSECFGQYVLEVFLSSECFGQYAFEVFLSKCTISILSVLGNMCLKCFFLLSVLGNMCLKCFFQNAQYAFWVFWAICACPPTNLSMLQAQRICSHNNRRGIKYLWDFKVILNKYQMIKVWSQMCILEWSNWLVSFPNPLAPGIDK